MSVVKEIILKIIKMEKNEDLKTVQGEWMGETRDEESGDNTVIVKETSCSFD